MTDLAACDATGLLNVANCADARSRHNEADIEEVNDKLMQKKEYIDNLAAEIGVDPVTGEGIRRERHEPDRHERGSHCMPKRRPGWKPTRRWAGGSTLKRWLVPMPTTALGMRIDG